MHGHVLGYIGIKLVISNKLTRYNFPTICHLKFVFPFRDFEPLLSSSFPEHKYTDNDNDCHEDTCASKPSNQWPVSCCFGYNELGKPKENIQYI